MKENPALMTAHVRTEIALLQAEERRLSEILSSTLTAPELRMQTQVQLDQTLRKLMFKFSEITRLESGQ